VIKTSTISVLADGRQVDLGGGEKLMLLCVERRAMVEPRNEKTHPCPPILFGDPSEALAEVRRLKSVTPPLADLLQNGESAFRTAPG
jgi:hypothetical protein